MATGDAPSYAELERENARLRRELGEARAEQAAAERALAESREREAEGLAHDQRA